MLISLIKFTAWIFYHLFISVAFPIGKMIYRLTWKGTPAEFTMALTEDPTITKAATDAGMLHILMQYKAKILELVNLPGPITEEERQWGLWVQNYGENPQPDMIPAYFKFIDGLQPSASQELPRWGSVEALCEVNGTKFLPFPGDEFYDLYESLRERAAAAGPERAGWNDYYMTRWFILRSDYIAKVIAERTKLPGMVGGTCTWMANSVAQQIPAFREALERAGYAFEPPDMRNAVLHDMRPPAMDDETIDVEFEDPAPLENGAVYPVSVESADEIMKSLIDARIVSGTAFSTPHDIEQIDIVTTFGRLTLRSPQWGMAWVEHKEKESTC